MRQAKRSDLAKLAARAGCGTISDVRHSRLHSPSRATLPLAPWRARARRRRSSRRGGARAPSPTCSSSRASACSSTSARRLSRPNPHRTWTTRCWPRRRRRWRASSRSRRATAAAAHAAENRQRRQRHREVGWVHAGILGEHRTKSECGRSCSTKMLSLGAPCAVDCGVADGFTPSCSKCMGNLVLHVGCLSEYAKIITEGKEPSDIPECVECAADQVPTCPKAGFYESTASRPPCRRRRRRCRRRSPYFPPAAPLGDPVAPPPPPSSPPPSTPPPSPPLATRTAALATDAEPDASSPVGRRRRRRSRTSTRWRRRGRAARTVTALVIVFAAGAWPYPRPPRRRVLRL